MASGKDIARAVGQRYPALPTDRRTLARVENIFSETGITGLKIEAHEHIEMRCMESISNVVDLARSLAGDDPIKAQILTERIRAYSRRLDKTQNIFGG